MNQAISETRPLIEGIQSTRRITASPMSETEISIQLI